MVRPSCGLINRWASLGDAPQVAQRRPRSCVGCLGNCSLSRSTSESPYLDPQDRRAVMRHLRHRRTIESSNLLVGPIPDVLTLLYLARGLTSAAVARPSTSQLL